MNEKRPGVVERLRIPLAYGFAFVAASLTFAFRGRIHPFLGATYIVHVPTIAISAWFGGLGPGILATALSCLSSAYYLDPPDSLTIRRSEDLAGVLFLALTGTLVSVLSELRIRGGRRLEAALRSREALISVVSHELKNPLNALQLQVTRLGRIAGAEERTTEPLAIARQQIGKLVRMIDELLDLARSDFEKPRLVPEPLDLAELVGEVIARERAELEAAGCEVRTELARPVRGSWDKLRLDQVVTNLLSNAAKYGAGQPVTIKVFARDGAAVLEVHDGGIGIAAEDQERIFERFERAVSERSFGGFGLGLWIVKEIVTASGGKVTVESAPQSGATFTVTLPLGKAALMAGVT